MIFTSLFPLHFPGFEVEDATDDGVEYLVKKHPEILMVHLVPTYRTLFSLTSTGLNEILSLPSLSSLIIRNSSFSFHFPDNFKIVSKQLQTLELTCKISDTNIDDVLFLQILEQCGSTVKSLNLSNSKITGEILINYNETLNCLKNLKMSNCKPLTDNGLLNILQLCGSTLRSLDIEGTHVNGDMLSKYNGTLPHLKNLNMRNCKQFGSNGLLKMLQLCGSTLRSLDIGLTHMGRDYLSEYKGTLPCLENLKMKDCYKLTVKGLLHILQLCGSTLKSLDISGTDITGEDIYEYKGILPCLENLNFSRC